MANLGPAQVPALGWAASLGEGLFNDAAYGVVADAAGNVYIAGSSGRDILLAKYDSVGQRIWTRQSGGPSFDTGLAIAADTNGNVYVTGSFSGRATFGNTNLTSRGGADVFVAKYNSAGALIWVHRAGGGTDDFGTGVAVTKAGEIYVTGIYAGPADFGSTNLASQGVFLAKYSAAGTLSWVRQAGGTAANFVKGIGVDAAGNCCIAGRYSGTANFDNFILTNINNTFIAKYSPAGRVVWARAALAGADSALLDVDLAVDPSGNSYVAGPFFGTAKFGTPPISLTNSTGDDAFSKDIFVAKYFSNGEVAWAVQAGGAGDDWALGVAVDTNGNCYVTGQFSETASFATTNITSHGGQDLFMAKYNSAGTLVWVSQAGDADNEVAQDIALDGAGNPCVAGWFDGSFAGGTLSAKGGQDALVVQFAARPPSIITAPRSQVVLAGSRVSFTVGVRGSGPFHYQWLKDGVVLSNATNAELVIAHADISDQGSYSALITNAIGVATSVVAILTVRPDPTKPVLTVASPNSVVIVSSNSIRFTGTAQDNVGLSQVEVQAGNNSFVPALGTTNWSVELPLVAGTNLFRIRASDYYGNSSVTNTRVVFFSVKSPLQVITSDGGSVLPNLKGQLLEVGRNYRITAVASNQFMFSNWLVGAVSDPNPNLTFRMESNLVLTANFVSNPFLQLKGTYSGLAGPIFGRTHENSGPFTLTVTDKGAYTGKATLGGKVYLWSGQFSLGLNAHQTVGTGTNAVNIILQLIGGSASITGIITGQDMQNVQTELHAFRSPFDATHPPVNFIGRYTLLFSGAPNAEAGPLGQGCATLVVNNSGVLTLSGVLADGTPITQSATIEEHGAWPMYVSLYGGKGSFFGWLNLHDTIVTNSLSVPIWTKKAGAVGALYRGGFTNGLSVRASPYVAPGLGTNALGVTEASVLLDGGNLSQMQSATVTVSPASKLTVDSPNANKLVLVVIPATGQFSGSFLHPDTRRTNSIKGVWLQNQHVGGGFFPGTNQIGVVYVGGLENYPLF